MTGKPSRAYAYSPDLFMIDNLPEWDQTARTIQCPLCGAPTVNALQPYRDESSKYMKRKKGWSVLMVTPVWGKCGSRWDICIGVFDGQTVLFTRIVKECKDTCS